MTMDNDRGAVVIAEGRINSCVEQVNIFVGRLMKTKAMEELDVVGIFRLTHLLSKNNHCI